MNTNSGKYNTTLQATESTINHIHNGAWLNINKEKCKISLQAVRVFNRALVIQTLIQHGADTNSR